MKKAFLLLLALPSCLVASAQNDTIITNPSGTVKTYDLSTDQIVSRQTSSFSGVKSYIAFSDDGKKLYIKDFTPYINTGAWVEGDIKGDSVFIRSGQKVHHQDETENRMAIDVFLKSGALQGSSIEPDGEVYIKMKINADGSLSMPEGKGILAMDQYEDILCRNTAYLYRPFNLATDSVIAPAGVADKRYCLNYKDRFSNEIYKLVNVRRTQDDSLYVQGFAATYAPESWIKGVVKGSTATFAARQYQGMDGVTGEFFDFIYPGTRDYYSDLGYVLDDSLVFSYDKDKDEYTSEQSVLELLGDKISVAAYDEPSLKPYVPHAGKPSAPEMKYFSDYSTSSPGFLKISFNIAPVDQNGSYIDPAGMTWRLLVNGKPYTFKKDTYHYLTQDKESFAWGEQDQLDIVFEACGLYTIWFYDYAGAQNVAVESTYTYNGETYTTTSEPLAVSAAAGVNQVETGSAVTGTVCHDLQGRTLLKPANGISLKTVTYADGSKRTLKVIQK